MTAEAAFAQPQLMAALAMLDQGECSW